MNSGDPVPSAEYLLRRGYCPQQIRRDGTVTSRAFVARPKDEGKLSVDIESLTTLAVSIKDASLFRLCRILTSDVYNLGLGCIYDPLADNIAHALITGLDGEDLEIPQLLSIKATVLMYPD